MKFPKSIHAEGWDDHIDTSPAPLTDGPARSASPLHGVKGPGGIRMNGPHLSPRVAPDLSTTPPVTARIEPQPRAAALPPQRQSQANWKVAAGAGAAVIAALAVWAANRPHHEPVTPAAIVTGSVAPQTEVAAATPVAPQPDTTTATVAPKTTVEPAQPTPATVGLPVTTVKPAPETRAIAQAPAPRPDMVVRAAPRTGQAALLPTPQAPTTVAAAPAATDPQPTAVTPGTAPIVMPPTAAGPVSTSPGTPPLAGTAPAMPLASNTPDTAATSTSPGTPPLAQAQPQQPAPAPVLDDGGITAKVRSALATDSTLAAVPIIVSTDHGVVRLEGQAPDGPTRERATVVASSATGVRAVDNRLTVPLPSAPLVSQAQSQNGL